MRNKKTVAMMLLLVTIVVMMFAVLVACVDPAKPQKVQVVVTFNTAGGTPIEPVKIQKGARVQLPESPEWDGYEFQYWAYDADGNNIFDTTTPIEADITIYAVWEEIEIPPVIDPDAPVKQKIDTVGALKKIFGGISVPENIVNINFEIGAKDIANGKNYLIELKANAASGADNNFKFVVSEVTDVVAKALNGKATVIDENGNLAMADGSTGTTVEKKVLFGVYLTGSKMYMQAEGTPMMYIEEINGRYIIDLVEKGLIKLGDMNLGDLELTAGLTLEGIINMLMGMLFGSPDYTITQKVSHDITLPMNINSFIDSISSLLNGIDIGGLLGFELNIGPLLAFLSNSIPPLDIKLKAHMQGLVPVTDMIALDVVDKKSDSPNYKNQIFYINVNAGFGEEIVDIGIPEIKEFVPFSLTNLAFSLDFKLESAANGEHSQVDVGQIINMFLGDTANVLPANLVMLDIEFGFRLKFAIDLNMNYDKKPIDLNRILIELWLIDSNGNELDIDGNIVPPDKLNTTPPALSFVYKDSLGYLNLGNLVPNYYGAKNIKVDLSKDDNGDGLVGIAGLIDSVVKLLTDLIDGALGTDWDGANLPASQGEVIWKNDDVVGLAIEGNGQGIVSPGVTEMVKVIAGVIGLEDFIKAEGNAITVTVNNGFLDKLLPLISKIANAPIDFRFPDGVGDIVLAINLANYGIDNIEITGNIDNLNASIKMSQFWVGFEKENLDEIITNRIGDPNNSTSSLKTLLDKALEGINVNINLKFTILAGNYDLAPMLLGFAPDLKSLLGDKHLVLHFTEDMTLDLSLRLRIALDKNDTANSTIALELVTNRDIVVGNNILIGKDATILGIYGYDNKVYAGLTGVKFGEATLPNFAIDMDFTTLLYHFLSFEDIDLIFDLQSLLFPEDPKTEEEISKMMFAEGGKTVDGTELTAQGQILVGWNYEALTINASLGAVLQLLEVLNVDLSIDLSAIKGLAVNLSLGRTGGIELDVDAAILPRVELDGDGNVVGEPTYDDSVSIHLEIGTEENPFYIGDISDIIATVKEKITGFDPFDIPAISFDIDLFANTTSGDTSAPIDLGAMINMLAGSIVVPEGILMVNLQYGLRLSVALDLGLNSQSDESLMAIELSLLGPDGQPSGVNGVPDLGLYYKNGSAYADFGNLLPNFYTGKNVRLDTNLKDFIDVLLKKLQEVIDVALDGLINPKPANGEQALATAGEAPVDKTVIPAGYADLFNIIAAVLNIEDFVTATENKISVAIGDGFFKGLSKVVGDIDIAWPSFLDEIHLDINVNNKNGIDSIEANGKILRKVENSTDDAIAATLKIKNLNMRDSIPELAGKIDTVVNSKAVSNTLYDVFYDVLGGVNLSANIKLQFKKGTYDLAPFIAGFGLPQFEQQHLLWTFKEDFVLDAVLQIQISLDMMNPSKSMLVVELRTGAGGINIGGDLFIPGNTVILGLYGYQNSIYLDVSNLKIANITLPKLKLDLDFTTFVDKILKDKLKDIKFAFDLVSILPKDLFPAASGSDEQSKAKFQEMMFVDGANSSDLSTAQLSDAGKIFVSLNVRELTANVTLATILQLLADMSVDMGSIDMSNWTASVDLIASRERGLAIDVDADIVPLYEKNNEGKFDRVYGKSGLKLHMEAGSENYPIRIGDLNGIKYDLSRLAAETNKYTDDLIDAIVGTVGKAQLKAKVNLKTLDGTMNLTKIINDILATQGKEFNLPINLHLDDWDTEVDLDIAWNLDLKNSRNIQLKVEFTFNQKLLLGLYLYKGSVILDLTGFGLFKAELTNTPFVKLIAKELDNLVSGFGQYNLTEIINKLLKDSGLGGYLPGADGSTGIESVVDGNAENSGAVEPTETMDWIEYVLAAIHLENAKLFLNFDAEMIDTLFNSLLGFGIGIDLSANGNIDLINGTISLGVKVEDISLDILLALQVGKFSDLNMNVDEIPDWDATNGRIFAENMLDNLDIGFYLDFANKSGDTKLLETQNSDTVTDNNAMYTRVVIEKLKQDKVCKDSSSGEIAPANSFLITLQSITRNRYDNSNVGNPKDIAYINLRYKTSQLRILLGKNVLSLGAIYDFAGAVAFTIEDIDLISTLATTFDDLFKKIGDLSIKTETESDPNAQNENMSLANASARPTSFEEVFANFDILKLFQGIDVTLSNTGLFNANASLDSYVFNKLIDDILPLLFGPNTILDLSKLAPTIFKTNWLSYVDWDRIDAGKTWGSLKAQLVGLLREVLTGIDLGALAPLITDAILGDVSYQIRQLLVRFLPLPVYNQIDVGVNIMQGTLANIYVLGYDNNQDILDPDGNVYTYTVPSRNNPSTITHRYTANAGSGRASDHMTEIWLYNTSPSVGNPVTDPGTGQIIIPEGVITWGDIDTHLVFDPLTYADTSVGKTQFILDKFSNKVAKYQRGIQLSKAPVTFKWMDGAIAREITDIDFAKRGTYNLRATVVFGTNKEDVTRTLDIVFDVYSNTKILGIGQENQNREYVEGMSMFVYQPLPDYLLVKTEEGTRRVETKYMTFVDYKPTTYKQHNVIAKIGFVNGTQTTVAINYLDSTISDIFGGKEIEMDLYNLDIDPNNPDRSTIAQFTPETLYFKYSTGFFDKIKVNKWETADAETLFDRIVNPETGMSSDLSGGRYYITAKVGSGVLAQDVLVQFVVKSKNVNFLSINGTNDKTVIDPYQYYLYMLTKDEKYNPYPTEVEANYYYKGTDGKGEEFVDMYSEKVDIVWNMDNLSNIDYSWTNTGTDKRKSTVTFDNGKMVFDETTKTDKKKYNGSFTWSKEVGVEIVRNEILGIFFDEEMTKNSFEIDPFLFNKNKDKGIQNFAANAYVLMTNGNVYYLPIAWEKNIVDNYRPDYEESFEQFKITIGFDTAKYAETGEIAPLNSIKGNLIQEFYVNVVVLGNTAKGIQVDGSSIRPNTTYIIDPVSIKYLGAEAFPKTVVVEYTNKTTAELPVEWEYDTNITIHGTGILTARCIITQDVIFDVKYKVLDRSNPYLEKTQIDINSYKFTTDELGNRLYDAYSKELSVRYKTGLWNVTVQDLVNINTIEFVNLTVAEKDAKLAEYADKEKFSVQAVEKIDKFDLPVTWSKDNVSYSNARVYNISASLVGGTEAAETFAMTAKVAYDKVVFVDGGMRVEEQDGVFIIIQGGTNLSESGATFKLEMKELNVTFQDESGKKYTFKINCTIDLKGLDLNKPTTKIVNGKVVQVINTTDCYIMRGSDLQQKIQIKYTIIGINN